MRVENVDVEYKEIYVKSVNKEVLAFANTEGGVIYIGISNDGTVLGVEDVDDTMLRIASSLKDSIKPDIMPFVQIRAMTMEYKQVVEISVSVGAGRPYYLSEKGLKPEGVYVRRGSACQPLSDEGIRELIMQNSGRSFETGRSMQQELTFDSLQKEFKLRDLQLGEAQLRTLHLLGEDGLYTNLALLLSDQCEHTIKIAVFKGGDKENFHNRKEFCGSLLKQLKDVYQFLDMCNETKAEFSGLLRIDKSSYPQEALREALLNAIIHRDYSFSASTIINIFNDRMEFISLGGLVPGISMDAVRMGVSQSRNPNLANVFYRLHLVESYGTGISKICRLYAKCAKQPELATAQGVFKVVLYNMNEMEEYLPAAPVRLVREVQPAYDDDKALLHQYAIEKGRMTRKEAEELLGSGSTKAYKLIKLLCAEGKLQQKKAGRLTIYIPS